MSNTDEITIMKFILLTLICVIIYIYIVNNTSQNSRKNILVLICSDYKPENIKDNNLPKHNIKYIINNNYIQKCNNLLNEINNYYYDYDGFIIIDRNETINYTCNMLSFFIENIKKPIILDIKNLRKNLEIINNCNINEVMVRSKDKLLRASRTIKFKNHLVSPNFKSLNNNNKLKDNNEKMIIRYIKEDIKINLIKIYPNMDTNKLKYLQEEKKLDVVIIENYDNGYINNNFLKILENITKKGVIVINISQNNSRISNINEDYILDGKDISTEACIAKCYFLLSSVKDKKTIRKIFNNSFRGEISN